MKHIILILAVLVVFENQAQEALSANHLESAAVRFTLGENHEPDQKTKELFMDLIGDNQFVGIAEVHQSQQLSYFTTGFLPLLSEKGFKNFALEVGPNAVEILQEASKNPGEAEGRIRELNRKYGRNAAFKTPLMFADKVEDALFIEKAARLQFSFWGLDQEFDHSSEMYIDKLYGLAKTTDSELNELYAQSRKIIQKVVFKNKVSGMGKNCWLMENATLKEFFRKFDGNLEAEKIIHALRASWGIYCLNESRKPSNQKRADYMKSNFDSLYQLASKTEDFPKVLVKLGGVHLTHGLSPFRVDDMGKHLHEKAIENKTGFLSIRHLITYRNGKSNIGKSGWKGVEMFLELGRRDQWTLVDLRPFRDKVLNRELTTNKKYLHELTSYDLLLIPPDDKVATINY